MGRIDGGTFEYMGFIEIQNIEAEKSDNLTDVTTQTI